MTVRVREQIAEQSASSSFSWFCSVSATVTIQGSNAQAAKMGIYTLQDAFHNGRPCYKHESSTEASGWMYYDDGVWFVGEELGSSGGCSMAVLDCAEEPAAITATWKVFTGKQWVFEEGVGIIPAGELHSDRGRKPC